MIYPIGEQDFASIRKRGLVYVDKTELVYKMTHESKYYFLSRPRRFGKSLLLSTLENYFLGNKEAFQGLAIDKLENEWQQYPVLTLTLGKGEYKTLEDLHVWLDYQLSYWEKQYHYEDKENDAAVRFTNVIQRAHKQTRRQVVILIDEYDAPLQAALNNPELLEQYQSTLRNLYLCLKSNDKHIHFAFLTGITAWGKIGVFSALNNLKDISLDRRYATICGITEEELHNVFHDEVALLAEENHLTTAVAYQRLKAQYDGYHFSNEGPGVYNPFSLLRALDEKRLNNYWIQTGETQLIANIVEHAHIDIEALLNEVSMPIDNMLNNKSYLKNPNTFLYQAGYLTIKSRDDDRQEYILEIPNNEVRFSLGSHLIAPTFGLEEEQARLFRGDLRSTFNNVRVEEMVKTLNEYIFFKGNYMTMGDKELYFQNTLATVFRVVGYRVEVEKASAQGRADLVVQSDKYIYVIETKLDISAQQALEQINEKGYADAFKNDARPIVKLGLNFSEEKRTIDDFAYEM